MAAGFLRQVSELSSAGAMEVATPHLGSRGICLLFLRRKTSTPQGTSEPPVLGGRARVLRWTSLCAKLPLAPGPGGADAVPSAVWSGAGLSLRHSGKTLLSDCTVHGSSSNSFLRAFHK